MTHRNMVIHHQCVLLLTLTLVQAMATLVSDSTAKVTASTVQASEQLAGAIDRLHSSNQTMAAAAKESNTADTDLATKLATAAAQIGDDTTGAAHMQLVAALDKGTPAYQTTLTKLLAVWLCIHACIVPILYCSWGLPYEKQQHAFSQSV